MSKPSRVSGATVVLALAASVVSISASPDGSARSNGSSETEGRAHAVQPSSAEAHSKRHIRRRSHGPRHKTLTMASAGGTSLQPDGALATSAGNRSTPASANGITVIVNGEVVTDLEHAPVIRNGSLLIPLNGILDRMAATVAWQGLTKTVDVQRGATHIRLVANSPEARINGMLQQMDVAPEVIGGTIMVPLRFIADSLGLQTDWNPTSRQLTLDSAAVPAPHSRAVSPQPQNPNVRSANSHTLPPELPGATFPGSPAAPIAAVAPIAPIIPVVPVTPVVSPLPPPTGGQHGDVTLPTSLPPSTGTVITVQPPAAIGNSGAGTTETIPEPPKEIHGQLAGVSKADGVTLISVTAEGGGQRLQLAPNAILLGRSASRLARQEIALENIYPGDDVTLHLNAQGQVTLIEVAYRNLREQIQAIAGDKLLLANGQVVSAAHGVSVTLPTGAPGELDDLHGGEMVALRLNPTTNMAWRIDARPGAGEAIPDASTVHIGSVAVDSAGPYLAGQELMVTMHGSPGGSAWFTIPGMDGRTAMKENDPGEYTGQLIVQPGISITNSPVVAHLTQNDETAHPLQALQSVTIDSLPPTVKEMIPAANSTASNHQGPIYAIFDDHNGTGADPASVHLSVNGLDATGHCQITDRFVTCTGLTLPDGVNRVILKVKDKAGNFSVVPWQFNEETAGSQIHTVSFKRSHTRGGERVTVNMEGAAGGNASFDLGPENRDQPMKEVRAGRYEGSLVLQRGDELVNIPVTGRLKLGDQSFTRLSSDNITNVDGHPTIPIIEGPVTGSEIQNPLVVFGHADPGVKVRVKVEYENRLYSMFGTRGLSSEQDAVADENGVWRTNPVGLATQIPGAHHVVYRISSEAINAGGHTSKSTHVRVYRDMR